MEDVFLNRLHNTIVLVDLSETIDVFSYRELPTSPVVKTIYVVWLQQSNDFENCNPL